MCAKTPEERTRQEIRNHLKYEHGLKDHEFTTHIQKMGGGKLKALVHIKKKEMISQCNKTLVKLGEQHGFKVEAAA